MDVNNVKLPPGGSGDTLVCHSRAPAEASKYTSTQHSDSEDGICTAQLRLCSAEVA